ncbi:proton myo-inositol cotransporter-like [Pollicipes pollicipes]|uniref:proton myo-inositol cotransporter-like n=1 Tax=Pollicipes pollicipes TaxID=41117 RepID=UPI001884DBC1|nr:proton myo-inositol cotransporter-like [Pollicipes pollicipes]
MAESHQPLLPPNTTVDTGTPLPSGRCAPLYVLTFLSAIGGFLFGYDTGVVSGAMVLVRAEFRLSDTWHELIVAGTVGSAWLLSLAAGPLLLGLLAVPESPRFLLGRGRRREAAAALARLRPADFPVDLELQRIGAQCAREARRRPPAASLLVEMLRRPTVRRALLLGCGLQLFQQLTGINTVMYYSASIIQLAGVRDVSLAIWLAAITAAVNFVGTLVGLVLVERLGRRPLTLASLLGAALSLLLLAGGFLLNAAESPPVVAPPGSPDCDRANCAGCQACPASRSWLAVLGLCLYLICFSPGMGPMPWTVNAEIYPAWARGTGSGLAASCNWLANLAVSLTFLTLVHALGRAGVFFLYAGLAAVGWIVFFRWLPETRGVPLEDMAVLFGGDGDDPPLSEDDHGADGLLQEDPLEPPDDGQFEE